MPSPAIPITDAMPVWFSSKIWSPHPIRELMQRFPEESVSTEGKEKHVHKVIDTLIHRHIYFGYSFGTDDEFTDMLTEIVYTLLRR